MRDRRGQGAVAGSCPDDGVPGLSSTKSIASRARLDVSSGARSQPAVADDCPDKIDRRRFLSGAALGAAGFVVGGNAPRPPTHSHDDEHQRCPPTSPCASRRSIAPARKRHGPACRLDEIVQTYEQRIGPRNGARVVARAWTDPDYKRRLIDRRHHRYRGHGIHRRRRASTWSSSRTRRRCTTCGLHAVLLLTRGPRSGSRLPGTIVRLRRARSSIRAACFASSAWNCPDDVEVRVWDSTAELRYLGAARSGPPDTGRHVRGGSHAALVTRN